MAGCAAAGEQLTDLSRRLAYVLRHNPAAAGVELDEAGWADVSALLAGLARDGQAVPRSDLDRLVATSLKQRFAYDATGERIRAQQGHTVPVDLGLPVAEPPATLFHGTVASSVPAILAQGLTRGRRHHLHLSADGATARTVGGRRGRPVVLVVDAGSMARDGHTFYVSGNGVWLTDRVPPGYLRVQPEQSSEPDDHGAGG